jgi:hypothetical protein
LVTASGYGDGKIHPEVAEACDFLKPHWNGTNVEHIPAPDLRTTGVWRSLERRIQIPRRPASFSSLPSVLPTEGNEENEREGNWVCVSSRSFWAFLLRSVVRPGVPLCVLNDCVVRSTGGNWDGAHGLDGASRFAQPAGVHRGLERAGLRSGCL